MSCLDVNDWFIQSTVYTLDDPFHNHIIKNDVLGAYALILDQNNRCVLSYEMGWKLPYFKRDYLFNSDDEFLKSYLHEEYDLSVQYTQLIGSREFRKKSESKYAYIYLAKITSKVKLDQQQITLFSFSQLIELTIYNDFKPVFDTVYNPLKLDLILDIDRTLLMSYTLGNVSDTISSSNLISRNHYILQKNYNPDYIANTHHYTKCIWLRPYLYYFLETVSKLTKISFWTASDKMWQQQIVEISQLNRYSKRFFYADTCIEDGLGIYKSLTELNKREDLNYFFDPEKTLMVDDSSLNRQTNPRNCLKVPIFEPINATNEDLMYCCKNDCTLMMILPVIKAITDGLIHNNEKITDIEVPIIVAD